MKVCFYIASLFLIVLSPANAMDSQKSMGKIKASLIIPNENDIRALFR